MNEPEKPVDVKFMAVHPGFERVYFFTRAGAEAWVANKKIEEPEEYWVVEPA